MNQKSVFEFGDEYQCQSFWCTDRNVGGVDVRRNGNFLGEIIGLNIHDDIDDIDENVAFDNEVINWLVDNEQN